jgi:hypothetical protein
LVRTIFPKGAIAESVPFAALAVPGSGRSLSIAYAWHFKRYQDEQPKEEREACARLEELAKAQRNGLWRDSSPIPPWDWRGRK